MSVKKKRASGGALLLKTKGTKYFSELAKKSVEKRKEDKELATLWKESQTKKRK